MGYLLPRAPTRSFDRENSEKEMRVKVSGSGNGGMKVYGKTVSYLLILLRV